MNKVILAGEVTSIRNGSGNGRCDGWTRFEVSTECADGTASVPCIGENVGRLSAGDVIEVHGHVRRRFGFRGGSTFGVTEVVVGTLKIVKPASAPSVVAAVKIRPS